MKTATDAAQTRWLLFAQKGSSIPTPFLVVVVSWLVLILASFSLFAPRNATAFVTLLVCALAGGECDLPDPGAGSTVQRVDADL